MLATDILVQDHKEALGLIASLQALGEDAAPNADNFAKMKKAVELHLRAEEEVYYPALVEHEEFSELLEDSLPEHETVKEYLTELTAMEPGSSEFQSMLADLYSAIEDHAGNEESDVFPRSLEILGKEKLQMLATDIDELKREFEITKSAGM